MKRIEIDLYSLHGGQAKLAEVTRYMERAEQMAGYGNEVILTGPAPVWMYLKIAHALHGKATVLKYLSPATGEFVVFDHNPY
jgi:hypothetical protein